MITLVNINKCRRNVILWVMYFNDSGRKEERERGELLSLEERVADISIMIIVEGHTMKREYYYTRS